MVSKFLLQLLHLRPFLKKHLGFRPSQNSSRLFRLFHSTSFSISPLPELVVKVDTELDDELDNELDDETSPLFSVGFSAMRADPSASAWRSSACGKASDDRDFDVDVVASSTRSTRSRSRYRERYQDMAQ